MPLENRLWSDPVLVAFSTLAIQDIFKYNNDAHMKCTNNGDANAVNLDTGTFVMLGDTVQVEVITGAYIDN